MGARPSLQPSPLRSNGRSSLASPVHALDKDKQPILRPAGYGDFLILVRRRDATFEEIIRALKTAGVPVAGADRLKLSSHIVFDDLKSLARFALFPDDDLSLAEVLRSPFCDVDPTSVRQDSLFELAGREKRRGLWRELQARAGEHASWARARDLMQAMIAARDSDPVRLLLAGAEPGGRHGRVGPRPHPAPSGEGGRGSDRREPQPGVGRRGYGAGPIWRPTSPCSRPPTSR